MRDGVMANVTAADVKRLREQTGAGILDCKKALEACDGDFTAAVEALRIKGVKDMDKRASRSATNGLVAVALDGSAFGIMFELNCETDFVAKTELFGQLAADIAETAAAAKPADRLVLLAAQARSGVTVQQLIADAAVALKEKLELGRLVRFDGGYVTSYLHKSDPSLPPTRGALVQFDSDGGDVTREIAQQIVAMRPGYLRREDVPADVVESERRIAEQITRDEGKPEQIIPKIVEGRLNRFYADVVLTEQAFVKDPKKTVKQVLDEKGVTVRGFARFQVGQA
jgi:elongation factor Ts